MPEINNPVFEISFTETPTGFTVSRRELDKDSNIIDIGDELIQIGRYEFNSKLRAQNQFNDLIDRLEDSFVEFEYDGRMETRKAYKKVKSQYSPGNCVVAFEVLPFPFKITAL